MFVDAGEVHYNFVHLFQMFNPKREKMSDWPADANNSDYRADEQTSKRTRAITKLYRTSELERLPSYRTSEPERLPRGRASQPDRADEQANRSDCRADEQANITICCEKNTVLIYIL